jgi:putative endonuclease
MWFVYLLECSDENKSLYCGITNNLEKRIKTHNLAKGSKFTKTRLPVKLYWYEESLDRSSASKKEYQIKRLSRERKLALRNTSN